MASYIMCSMELASDVEGVNGGGDGRLAVEWNMIFDLFFSLLFCNAYFIYKYSVSITEENPSAIWCGPYPLPEFMYVSQPKHQKEAEKKEYV